MPVCRRRSEPHPRAPSMTIGRIRARRVGSSNPLHGASVRRRLPPVRTQCWQRPLATRRIIRALLWESRELPSAPALVRHHQNERYSEYTARQVIVRLGKVNVTGPNTTAPHPSVDPAHAGISGKNSHPSISQKPRHYWVSAFCDTVVLRKYSQYI